MDIQDTRDETNSILQHMFQFKEGQTVVLLNRFQGKLSEPGGSFYNFAFAQGTCFKVKTIDMAKGTLDCVWESAGLELDIRFAGAYLKAVLVDSEAPAAPISPLDNAEATGPLD